MLQRIKFTSAPKSEESDQMADDAATSGGGGGDGGDDGDGVAFWRRTAAAFATADWSMIDMTNEIAELTTIADSTMMADFTTKHAIRCKEFTLTNYR